MPLTSLNNEICGINIIDVGGFFKEYNNILLNEIKDIKEEILKQESFDNTNTIDILSGENRKYVYERKKQLERKFSYYTSELKKYKWETNDIYGDNLTRFLDNTLLLLNDASQCISTLLYSFDDNLEIIRLINLTDFCNISLEYVSHKYSLTLFFGILNLEKYNQVYDQDPYIRNTMPQIQSSINESKLPTHQFIIFPNIIQNDFNRISVSVFDKVLIDKDGEIDTFTIPEHITNMLKKLFNCDQFKHFMDYFFIHNKYKYDVILEIIYVKKKHFSLYDKCVKHINNTVLLEDDIIMLQKMGLIEKENIDLKKNKRVLYDYEIKKKKHIKLNETYEVLERQNISLTEFIFKQAPLFQDWSIMYHATDKIRLKIDEFKKKNIGWANISGNIILYQLDDDDEIEDEEIFE